jgi:hypothetical protein
MSNTKTGDRVVHAPPHLSLNATTATAFKLPALVASLDQVPWQEFAFDQQLLFRGEHTLGDNAESIAWGIAMSPLQDLVAVSISHQPTTVPIYTNLAGEESKVVVLPPEGGPSEGFTFPTPLDLDSAEGNPTSDTK